MKPLIPKSGQRNLSVVLLLTILLLTFSRISFAQLPDCVTGNTAYTIFNDSLGSGPATPSQIRPVNLTTGAIGPLVGGVSYLISKTSGGSTYYGSSALGVDIITNRMYVMTQMSSGADFPKDIITINPVTAAMTVIATTTNVAPVFLGRYHFVKLAIHPTNGFGYAVGVVRDTTIAGVGANQINPLIRFSTCGGAPGAGCANASVITLGFLPTLPGMFRWELFNGDIAFDAAGNLYFASAAFRRVNGANRYTDARLYKINAGNIPGAAGVGVIPMTLLADYDGLDSTVINGIALNSGGNMYITTRRFNGIQNSVPAPTFTNQLYSSGVPGVATLMPFTPKPVGFSVADLASCYFPLTILPEDKLDLAGKYSTGYSTLLWRANNNKNVKYFEIQRSEDFTNNYVTIATVARINPDMESQAYVYKDPQAGFGKNKYYRVREVMMDGRGIYSNVLKISFNQKFNLISKPKPNPFMAEIELNIQLQSVNQVSVRLIDESGRLALQKRFDGQRGENRFSLNGISHLKSGIYILEISAEGEVVREKLVKE